MRRISKIARWGKWFCILATITILCVGMSPTQAQAVDTTNNNFTMIDGTGGLVGGTNDVHFTWDGTTKTAVAASGQVSNATLSSACTFFGLTWNAHDLAIYGPGTYTVYDGCASGEPGCGTGNAVSFTVGAGEMAAHMLFNWGATTNIDVVDIWSPGAVFGPSPMWTTACGSNSAAKVWDWMSKDWDGDGSNGAGMTDGAFPTFNANFNVMGVPSTLAAVTMTFNDNTTPAPAPLPYTLFTGPTCTLPYTESFAVGREFRMIAPGTCIVGGGGEKTIYNGGGTEKWLFDAITGQMLGTAGFPGNPGVCALAPCENPLGSAAPDPDTNPTTCQGAVFFGPVFNFLATTTTSSAGAAYGVATIASVDANHFSVHFPVMEAQWSGAVFPMADITFNCTGPYVPGVPSDFDFTCFAEHRITTEEDPGSAGFAGWIAQWYVTGGTSVPDAIPPTVVSTNPPNGLSGISPSTATFSITFSEGMDPATVTADSISISGGVTVGIPTGASAVFEFPISGLVGKMTYTVTFNAGPTDIAGNPLTLPYETIFTTAPEADGGTPLAGTLGIDPGIRDVGGNYVSGSYFAMGSPDPNGPPESVKMLQPGPAAGIVLGSYQPFVLDPDIPAYTGPGGNLAPGSGYAGTPTQQSDIALPFLFFGLNAYVGTNPIAYQSGTSHAAPVAVVNGAGDLTMDLGPWEVMWSGTAFEQGPRLGTVSAPIPLQATGTYDSTTGWYVLDWPALIVGGSFNGVTGYWHLEGTIDLCAGVNCDDSNVCTDDSCDTATGCVNTNNTAACDDGDLCTTGDVCSGGTCSGTPNDCSDNDACTTDVCDSGTGACSNPAITCNDNDTCTDDTCDTATGCEYTDNGACAPVGGDGDMNNDGDVTVADALLALRIVAGIDAETTDSLSHCDVAPLVSNVSTPDGKCDIGDVVVILRKAVGLI